VVAVEQVTFGILQDVAVVVRLGLFPYIWKYPQLLLLLAVEAPERKEVVLKEQFLLLIINSFRLLAEVVERVIRGLRQLVPQEVEVLLILLLTDLPQAQLVWVSPVLEMVVVE
jgi:hypothetical protein